MGVMGHLFSPLLPQEKKARDWVWWGFYRNIYAKIENPAGAERRAALASGQGLGQPLGTGYHASLASNAVWAPQRGGRTRYLHPKSTACHPTQLGKSPSRRGQDAKAITHAVMPACAGWSPLPPPLLTGGHEDDPPHLLGLNAP